MSKDQEKTKVSKLEKTEQRIYKILGESLPKDYRLETFRKGKYVEFRWGSAETGRETRYIGTREFAVAVLWEIQDQLCPQARKNLRQLAPFELCESLLWHGELEDD